VFPILTAPSKTPEEERFTRLLYDAVGALAYTSFYRCKAKPGNAHHGAMALHLATKVGHRMREETTAHLLDKGKQWLAGAKRGREKALEAKGKEHRAWLGEYRKLKREHPGWNRTRVAKEIGKAVGRSTSHVLRTLRRLEANEPSDS
jgi:hypothetical protein